MINARRAYIDAPTGQLHYRTAGEGDPLILLHQSPSSGRQFEAAFPHLAAAGYQVIAPDTPGYGMSDSPPETATIAMYAANIPVLMDTLGIEKAAILGHHTGASIACEAAVAYPERLTKLILNGTLILRDEERTALLARWPQEEVPIQEDGSHLLEPWRRRMAVSIGWTDLRAMTRSVNEMLNVRDHEWHGFMACYRHNLTECMEKVTQPAMILTNTGDDMYAVSRRGRRVRPDFTFVELPGGTHDIVDEQPEAWAAAVVGFLRG